MTLDDAIIHAMERANQDCGKCAEEHKQLANWLIELRDLQNIKGKYKGEQVMDFASAFISMQRGHKVARSHWAGYWCIEDEEIIMHCRDGRIINIRESEDMIYTISNMACNDWRIVDNEDKQ